MRRYETIIIIDPDLSEEDRGSLFERFEGLIPQFDGMVVEFDDWGLRKLAYEVKNKARGYYLRLDYCGTGALVDEIERFCRIDDRVLKYMTVLLEKEVDLEALKKALAEAEQAAAVSEEKPVEQPTEPGPDVAKAEAPEAPAAEVDENVTKEGE